MNTTFVVVLLCSLDLLGNCFMAQAALKPATLLPPVLCHYISLLLTLFWNNDLREIKSQD